jgi:hypothetical protein
LTMSPVLVAGTAGRISHSAAASIQRMTRAHVLADDDGTLLTRWIDHRADGRLQREANKKR